MLLLMICIVVLLCLGKALLIVQILKLLRFKLQIMLAITRGLIKAVTGNLLLQLQNGLFNGRCCMPVIGHGVEICTYTTRPSNPALGTIIYQTDTDEYLKYVNYGGANRWMQADIKSNRNIAINGGVDVWQRGTSFTVGASNVYTADRWQAVNYGQAGTFVVSQQSTNRPANFRLFLRTAASTAATTNQFLCQSFETGDVIKAQNKYVTLSFWYKNNVSPTVAWSANLLHSTAGDGNLMIPNTSTNFGSITLANTASWTFVTLTGLFPSTATSLAIRFDNANNLIANAGIDLTGIQLEIGTAPSEFEFEPYETTLRKCQRYYYPIKTGTSNSPVLYRFNYGGYDNVYHCIISLPVSPRITNGISFYDIAAGTRIHKPNVRWDNYSAISAEPLPGNDMNYQINITPSTNDGASFYGIYLYGIGIIYNGEL